MIARELAEKLKAAGLPWEPKRGDWFSVGKYDLFVALSGIQPPQAQEARKRHGIWLPTLSDILHEIEARGYRWTAKGCIVSGEQVYSVAAIKAEASMCYSADTPEEAAAKALLWVLKEGKA